MKLDVPEFTRPSAAWRSVPFWSLNDELAPAEIAKQLGAFQHGGFGGSYLHSRIGLLTEYLGPGWWEAMDAGVQASKELGLEAWFYDEDKWPSGFAGGLIPLMNEAFHARSLQRQRLDSGAALPPHADVLTEAGGYRYFCAKEPMGEPWFNGTCWVDLMNPHMVKAFIDCTYAPYARRYAGELGRTVKGIFTDEPQVSPRGMGARDGVLPYSPFIREAFKQAHGRDLAEVVSALFEEVGDYAKVRTDYFRTIARQFEASFSKQIGAFCAAHGLIWTGHFNGEETSRSVQLNVGNLMAHYRHMQQPGIDFLGLHLSGALNAMKSLSSVANQYSKPRRLSEMFGVSGQNMNFEDRAWIAGGHAVLGINHVCPHLAHYSLKGERKRDYPPTLSPQQPYWPHNASIEDRLARANYLSSVGEYAAELLVIHPLESAYIDYANDRIQGAVGDARFNRFDRILETLMAEHRDFDLGDEEILADIGRVADGALQVGAMRYRAVLLPPLRTLRQSTVALLVALRAAGGQVFAIGELPEFIDAGRAPATSAALASAVTRLPEQFADAMATHYPPALRIAGTGSQHVWSMRRTTAVGEPPGALIMLFNRSRLASATIRLTAAGFDAQPVIWDPSHGTCLAVARNGDSLQLHLAPAACLFVTTGALSAPATVTGEYALPGAGQTHLVLDGVWHGKRLEPNALTLDFARYSTDGGRTWSAAEPVIGIHTRFTQEQFNGLLHLEYAATLDAIPAHCELVLEQPQMYRAITVNGHTVTFGSATYRDLAFFRTAITPFLVTGINLIELELDYTAPIPHSRAVLERYGSEIESIYLIGEFGVVAEPSPEPARSMRNERGDLPQRPVHRLRQFRITEEPENVCGDLTLQGYPFYAGTFRLTRTFIFAQASGKRRYFLTFPATEAVVLAATLNGVELPPVAWSPWEVEVTQALRPGENRLSLTLSNSLRNLLGPHHHPGGELIAVGPGSFTGEKWWVDGDSGEPDWHQKRLTGRAARWVDDYHHIGFGLLQPPVLEVR